MKITGEGKGAKSHILFYKKHAQHDQYFLDLFLYLEKLQ